MYIDRGSSVKVKHLFVRELSDIVRKVRILVRSFDSLTPRAGLCRNQALICFFLSSVLKPQLNHWTKCVINT